MTEKEKPSEEPKKVEKNPSIQLWEEIGMQGSNMNDYIRLSRQMEPKHVLEALIFLKSVEKELPQTAPQALRNTVSAIQSIQKKAKELDENFEINKEILQALYEESQQNFTSKSEFYGIAIQFKVDSQAIPPHQLRAFIVEGREEDEVRIVNDGDIYLVVGDKGTKLKLTMSKSFKFLEAYVGGQRLDDATVEETSITIDVNDHLKPDTVAGRYFDMGADVVIHMKPTSSHLNEVNFHVEGPNGQYLIQGLEPETNQVIHELPDDEGVNIPRRPTYLIHIPTDHKEVVAHLIASTPDGLHAAHSEEVRLKVENHTATLEIPKVTYRADSWIEAQEESNLEKDLRDPKKKSGGGTAQHAAEYSLQHTLSNIILYVGKTSPGPTKSPDHPVRIKMEVKLQEQYDTEYLDKTPIMFWTDKDKSLQRTFSSREAVPPHRNCMLESKDDSLTGKVDVAKGGYYYLKFPEHLKWEDAQVIFKNKGKELKKHSKGKFEGDTSRWYHVALEAPPGEYDFDEIDIVLKASYTQGPKKRKIILETDDDIDAEVRIKSVGAQLTAQFKKQRGVSVAGGVTTIASQYRIVSDSFEVLNYYFMKGSKKLKKQRYDEYIQIPSSMDKDINIKIGLELRKSLIPVEVIIEGIELEGEHGKIVPKDRTEQTFNFEKKTDSSIGHANVDPAYEYDFFIAKTEKHVRWEFHPRAINKLDNELPVTFTKKRRLMNKEGGKITIPNNVALDELKTIIINAKRTDREAEEAIEKEAEQIIEELHRGSDGSAEWIIDEDEMNDLNTWRKRFNQFVRNSKHRQGILKSLSENDVDPHHKLDNRIIVVVQGMLNTAETGEHFLRELARKPSVQTAFGRAPTRGEIATCIKIFVHEFFNHINMHPSAKFDEGQKKMFISKVEG